MGVYRLSVNLHDQLIQLCIRETGLWAVIVSTDRHGKSFIFCSKHVGVAAGPTKWRTAAGVRHWRMWVQHEFEARAVVERVQSMKTGIDTRQGMIDRTLDTTRIARIIAWSDQQVLTQARFAAEHVLECGGSGKNVLFSLKALLPLVFYKPLFRLKYSPIPQRCYLAKEL